MLELISYKKQKYKIWSDWSDNTIRGISVCIHKYQDIPQGTNTTKMAKKKQQAGVSKKAEQKKKNQQIEDRTFGLKNKKNSKKVQSFVKSVTNSVNNSGDRKQRQEEERRKKQKEQQKLRKKQMKDEANALFNEGEF